VSHIPQRKEKDCLNCGTIVQGRYCQQCGQENVVPKETFWHMFTHFFYDITHFDSSFFYTIHHLILKPGFLSREYMIGRRARYLHPIRMYVFMSAIFFLLFFSFFKPKDASGIVTTKPLNAKQRADYLITLQEKYKKDTTNKALFAGIEKLKDTVRPFKPEDMVIAEAGEGPNISFSNKKYKTFEQYDSIEKTLPPSERDGWLARKFSILSINLSNKFRENPKEVTNQLIEGFLHRLPYMLFVSLPLFALILRLVYIRRKQFYFADHGVFTIHLYVFSFIVLLTVFSLDKLGEVTHWEFFDVAKGLLFLVLLCYLYIAMHNFYKQGWFKTFIKFLIVALLSLMMMLILFIIFLIFSAATV